MRCLAVVEDPALTYLATRGVPHLAAAEWLGMEPNTDNFSDVIAAARDIVIDSNVSAVICGRSPVTNPSIDQAVLYSARQAGIPSFVIQDFWGDVWPGQCQPDHYLVLDTLAASLTSARAHALPHVIGSLKHSEYQKLDFCTLRRLGRQTLNLQHDEIPVIGYFGQNLTRIAGYSYVLRDISDILRQLGPVALFYKPHPRESEASKALTLSLLNEHGIQTTVLNVPVEAAIAAADIVLSCFSTVGLDAAYMMCSAGAPETSIVFADYPEDLRAYWHPTTGLTEIPLVTDGIALRAGDASSLKDALDAALDPDERHRQAEACRKVFSNQISSTTKAFQLIAQVVRRHCNR